MRAIGEGSYVESGHVPREAQVGPGRTLPYPTMTYPTHMWVTPGVCPCSMTLRVSLCVCNGVLACGRVGLCAGFCAGLYAGLCAPAWVVRVHACVGCS